MAKELHTLLHNAKIDGPYIMAGHSFGGFNVRMYKTLYPHEVVGMVLVDANHPDQYKRLPLRLGKFNEDFLRKENFRRELIPFGIPRLVGWCGTGPTELRSMLQTIDCRLQPWREHLAELNDWDLSASQVRASPSLGNMPLVVISHDPALGVSSEFDRQMNSAWSKMQIELASLSINSSHIIATGSSHMIQMDRPDLVVLAIHKIVDKYRDVSSKSKTSGNESLQTKVH